MTKDMRNPKVTADHLERLAVVYVRQSTMTQVRENTASTARQYDLFQTAIRQGWPESSIQVIDQDQGLSGGSIKNRHGFEHLLRQVGRGLVGAVFCLEASRLSRCTTDWDELLDFCAATHTLVVDEHGVYDPCLHEDRLFLGIKGNISQAELRGICIRMQGGLLQRAREGKLPLRPPIGYIFDSAKNLVFDPDEQVQAAIRLLFRLFDQRGSAYAAARDFRARGLLFPKRRHHQLEWGSLRYSHALGILNNPRYAGAFVYGRTQFQTTVLQSSDGSQSIVKRAVRLEQDDWHTLILDAHPGYISWENYMINKKRLSDNCSDSDRTTSRPGAAREGLALLQGLVMCGVCGQRMRVAYNKSKYDYVYECKDREKHRDVKIYQCINGTSVDQEATRLILQVLEPAKIHVSMQAVDEMAKQNHQVERQRQMQLERANYEAELAKRRYQSVEPENRLVARNLERDWNEKLEEVERIKREQLAPEAQGSRPVSAQEREHILKLTQDISGLWHAPTTSNGQRKQLARYLIKDVTILKEKTTIRLAVLWQTGASTVVDIPQVKLGRRPGYAAEVIEQTRVLCVDHNNAQIAAKLNEQGHRDTKGGVFTAEKVWQLRRKNLISGGNPNGARNDGRYSASLAAQTLNVGKSTIIAWCKSGVLDAIQEKTNGPWWIQLTAENISQLSQPKRQRWSERRQDQGGKPTG